MRTSSAFSREFEIEYRSALKSYIETCGEPDLHRAYELGRSALDQGQAILEVARFHSDILLEILSRLGQDDQQKAVGDATAFLSEFLSPFEMTFRGFLDAVASLKNEINERRNAEEALRQSERYYKSLIENALDIVTIFDYSGIIRYASPSIQRVLGYSPPELAGRNIFEFVHPDDVDIVLEIFSTANRDAESMVAAEFRLKHRDGKWRIMESISKTFLDGQLVEGIIVNSRDITDRRYLEEIRRKYEFIVNASKEIMVLINANREFEAVNEAFCVSLSRSRETIIGKRAGEIFNTEVFKSRLESQIESCLTGHEIRSEDWIDLPGTGRRYIEIDFYPYRNILSAVTHAVVIMRDATERRNSEEKIREAQRQRAEDLRRYAQMTQGAQEDERRRISRELHDDICQRLTALKFHLNVVEDAMVAKKGSSAKRFQSVRKEIDDIIDGVKGISHNLRPSALDHFGLASALRLLCSEYGKLNALKVDFETKVPVHERYDSDVEIALYRIAQEALSNCVKHAGVNEASLKIAEIDDKLSMTITDHGKGFNFGEYLDREKAERHFGLINMRERVELCGGIFSVESKVGSGTTISVIVPIKQGNENGKN